MRIEGLEENKSVFMQSRFFSELPEEMGAVQEQKNAVFEEILPEQRSQEVRYVEMGGEIPRSAGVQPKTSTKFEENRSAGVNTGGTEIENVTVQQEIAPPEGQADIQQISDELERLSQRYGRRMEEWLYDQSSL